MIRRAFLALGLMLAGVRRRAWAQPVTQYAPLSRPVRIPVDQVAVPWSPVAFTAEALAPAAGTTAGRRVLISGVLYRKLVDANRSELSALCLTCPHEQCKVDLVTNPSVLLTITGNADHHPVFECGCHLSVFDAREDGARMTGEAPRGLFRFRIAGIQDATVDIAEVEAEALTMV
jgi:Rieske Fe-S protein